MTMVKYNAVMTLLVGASLLSLGWLGFSLRRPLRIIAEGWGLVLMGLGLLTGILGFLMSVTWPLTVIPHLGMLFGNIPMILGTFTFLAGMFMYWRWPKAMSTFTSEGDARFYVERVLSPVGVVFFTAGLGLAFFTAAVFQYQIFGSPPPQEPIVSWISQNIGTWVELTFAGGLIYGVGALGTLLFPFAARNLDSPFFRFVCVLLLIAGAAAAFYGALHLYTHVGLGENTLPPF